MSNIRFRKGGQADAHAIAQLHIKSWQRSYRGILSDEFLDGAVVEDRLGMWTQRLSTEPDASTFIQLAELGQDLVGFVCAMRGADERWGTLIDNLHVLSEAQGQGLGRTLLMDVAHWVKKQDPAGGMYLWVYEENRQARGFYERVGGKAVEQRVEIQPDGFDAAIVRYHWV